MNDKQKPATKFFQAEVDDYKKEFYESGYRSFMSVRLERFIREIDRIGLKEGAICLDAGCGPGYLTKALYERGCDTRALDASPEMLRLTRSLFEKLPDDKKPECIEGDIESLPFERGSFDLVASAGVIEYLLNDDKVMAEFYRVLKDGGYLILSSTNKYSPIGVFEPLIEAMKRNHYMNRFFNTILGIVGGTPVRPREFKVRKHTENAFKLSATKAGFQVISINYFYGLPWPHPFDRVFPRLSDYFGKKLERMNDTVIGKGFEGIYLVARKSDQICDK